MGRAVIAVLPLSLLYVGCQPVTCWTPSNDIRLLTKLWEEYMGLSRYSDSALGTRS